MALHLLGITNPILIISLTKKFNEQKYRIPTKQIDFQISSWLKGISIQADDIGAIQKVYQGEIKAVTSGNKVDSLEQLNKKTRL